MKRLLVGLVLVWILLTANLSVATCATHTIIGRDGQVTVCTTCCFGGSCTTTCF